MTMIRVYISGRQCVMLESALLQHLVCSVCHNTRYYCECQPVQEDDHGEAE